MLLVSRHGDAGTVHEDDLPGACLFLEKRRFQPSLIHGAGRVTDAAIIDVGNPCCLAADVNVGFGHFPFVALARDMLCLDESHDGVTIEPGASIVYVKVRRNDGVELSNVVF